jgi:hypothetical protein
MVAPAIAAALRSHDAIQLETGSGAVHGFEQALAIGHSFDVEGVLAGSDFGGIAREPGRVVLAADIAWRFHCERFELQQAGQLGGAEFGADIAVGWGVAAARGNHGGQQQYDN